MEHITYPKIAAELLRMKEEDQAMRTRWSQTKEWDQSVDDRNNTRLKEIVTEIGWPTISKVGDDPAFAAWLIAQHADLEFQKHCLRLMEEAGDDVHPQDRALLHDRVLVFSGEPQLYGTQFRTNEEGELEAYPIADEANLDARRKALGFCPFEEYKQRMLKSDSPSS